MQEISLDKTISKKIQLSSRLISTIILLSFALLTKLLTYFASRNSYLVERLYSSTIYPYIGKSMGFISSFVPFSIAELFLIGATISLVMGLILTVFKPRILLKNIPKIFHYIIRFFAIAYILFYFLWGFNYYREDYSLLANMNMEPATYGELRELTLEKIHKANIIRETLLEDINGIFFLEDSIHDLSVLANMGFSDYQVGGLNLGGNYGRAKPIFLSKYMSYTGIIGIYIPFTSEANINTDIPHSSILTTLSHEIAHQRGFAKEDEANFIAYKANINHPDERFQYSSHYFAMNQLLNEVYRQNKDDYSLLYQEISHAVRRDLDYSRDYWALRQGKVREKATSMNDNYLKANNQSQGVKSYSGVVNLLLAEYKDNLINK